MMKHEISELARNREKLTRLLERFIEPDPDLVHRKGELMRELGRSRSQLLQLFREKLELKERLDALPGLEEMLERYQSAGLEERLKEQSLLVREERVVKSMPERLETFREILEWLRRELPIDRTFISEKALDDLPGKEILKQADDVFARLNQELENLATQMAQQLDHADEALSTIQNRWEERRSKVQEKYEKILRELQKSRVDGEDFIRLRQQIEELRPLRDQVKTLDRDEKDYRDHRRNLLTAIWARPASPTPPTPTWATASGAPRPKRPHAG